MHKWPKTAHNLWLNNRPLLNQNMNFIIKVFSTCLNIFTKTNKFKSKSLRYLNIFTKSNTFRSKSFYGYLTVLLYRKKAAVLEHVYMRPEVNSNQFEISNCFEMLFRLHGNLHGDFIVATFQTIPRLYCTCADDIFN